LLDHGEVIHGLDDLIEHDLPHLGVDDLAAAEDDDELALVAFLEEAPDVLHLEVEVVLVGLRAELDLLQDDRRLVLARSLLLLRRLVLELAEVHDLADRGRRARVHLDELEPLLLGESQRLVRGEDADLRAVGADDAHLGHSNAAADAVVVGRARGGGIEWPRDVLAPCSVYSIKTPCPPWARRPLARGGARTHRRASPVVAGLPACAAKPRPRPRLFPPRPPCRGSSPAGPCGSWRRA